MEGVDQFFILFSYIIYIYGLSYYSLYSIDSEKPKIFFGLLLIFLNILILKYNLHILNNDNKHKLNELFIYYK